VEVSQGVLEVGTTAYSLFPSKRHKLDAGAVKSLMTKRQSSETCTPGHGTLELLADAILNLPLAPILSGVLDHS
jgi:hypothetical protein